MLIFNHSFNVNQETVTFVDNTDWGVSMPQRSDYTLSLSLTEGANGKFLELPTYNGNTVSSITIPGLRDGIYFLKVKAITSSGVTDYETSFMFIATFDILKCKDKIKSTLLGCDCSDPGRKFDEDWLDLFKLEKLLEAIPLFVERKRTGDAECAFYSAKSICGDNKCCSKC